MTAEQPAVEARGLSRTYRAAGRPVLGLEDVSLRVVRGEVVAVTGPSGSGKSTLLFLLAGLDRPDGGEVRVAGTDWRSLDGAARARFRRRTCGFIAQGMALLPQATAAENVAVPLLLDGVAPDARRERVTAALAAVELAGDGDKLPDQLSGGQQQRVAIARALVARPAVVLADEPTANLDSAAAQTVTRLLLAAAREREAAVVLVTHDPEVAAHADRVVGLRSGRLDPPGTRP
ncbi:MAG TPA: ABC transporter ATP-binding protein [Actinomycetes bacterium]|jgi:putative ABC transport system ATP-binding protein